MSNSRNVERYRSENLTIMKSTIWLLIYVDLILKHGMNMCTLSALNKHKYTRPICGVRMPNWMQSTNRTLEPNALNISNGWKTIKMFRQDQQWHPPKKQERMNERPHTSQMNRVSWMKSSFLHGDNHTRISIINEATHSEKPNSRAKWIAWIHAQTIFEWKT